jgi:prevent-host-death family protein
MVIDHGTFVSMSEIETMAISKFKATCLAVLKRVKRTGRPILITRFGQPIAEIVPPQAMVRGGSWLGSLSHRGRVLGDVVKPAIPLREWGAVKE